MRLLRDVLTIFIPENILSTVAVAIDNTAQVSKVDKLMDSSDLFLSPPFFVKAH